MPRKRTPEEEASKPLRFTNLEEIEEPARQKLPKMVYDYYATGAESLAALRGNASAYASYRLLPRVLVDVANVDTSTELLGHKLSFPVLVAPMAMQRMAHPDGEIGVARACRDAGTCMVVSTMATTPLEEVVAAGNGAFQLFQLYVLRDRSITKLMVEAAERAGYHGIVLTVDTPFLGKRELDEKNNFTLPEGLRLENLEVLREKLTGNLQVYDEGTEGSGLGQVFAEQQAADLTWDFLPWLRSVTKLPILLKGILSPEDAKLAADAGVDGIIVSNHGGRQLDHAAAPLHVLGAVVDAVAGRIPVLMDGGIRRGTDVLKALALGARAVLVGRPVLWGLTLGGEEGVKKVLEVLRSEVALALALAGCPSVKHVSRALLIPPGPYSRL